MTTHVLTEGQRRAAASRTFTTSQIAEAHAHEGGFCVTCGFYQEGGIVPDEESECPVCEQLTFCGPDKLSQLGRVR